MFATSMIDKYSSHIGGILSIDYHLMDTIGINIIAGYMHGSLTTIVTDSEGIIGNKVASCMKDVTKCGDITPNVPDYKQLTGIINVAATWSPVYGKLNLVSELDMNLQLYGVLGAGVNGTRVITANASAGAPTRDSYELSGVNDPQPFNNLTPHLMYGAGVKIFFFNWMALRAEVRSLYFVDRFDFGEGESAYPSGYLMGEIGLSFLVF